MTQSAVLSIDDFGAVTQDNHVANASLRNRDALTAALRASAFGDVVTIPAGKTYIMAGGGSCTGKVGVTLSIEGGLVADSDRQAWPADDHGHALHFFTVNSARNFTVTGGGSINGNGMTWWDGFILGEVHSRPRMFIFNDCVDLLFERLLLENAADQHVNFNRCARVEVRFVDIRTDRFKQRQLKTQRAFARARAAGYSWALERRELRELIEDIQHHGEYPGRTFKEWLLDEAVKLLPDALLQPEDLNTDGLDPSGSDFHIHDCSILNDDDSIAVKPMDKASNGPSDCTQNILIENMVLTGFGASIGSVPPSADTNCVRNITFRNISMPKTGKGIYVKSNPSCGKGHDRHGNLVEKTSIIDGITYENVRITDPFWWAIWIGPQQQHEPGSALGDDCALEYPLCKSSCPTQGCTTFSNIAMRNVQIERPMLSPGVILGNASNPMINITFTRVNVDFGGAKYPLRGRFPYGRNYLCHNAQITSAGSSPVPCSSEMVV
eukprot:TRINITY_DN44083_c0_g1_i1.p1 TRINITY_DN44083_c0_g1~~TRINITY_DN44083_c0_g1_i1.p1  ORF type:complete len:528 (-),score=79.84 TRINITY_DN44083_c0_g1_i1:162-1646(-)